MPRYQLKRTAKRYVRETVPRSARRKMKKNMQGHKRKWESFGGI